MKRLIILISVLIMILSMSTVSAFLFLPDTIDCEEFSVEIPEGLEIPHGYSDKEHSITLFTDLVEVGEAYRVLDLSTIPLGDLPNTMVVNNEYTEGDLKVMYGEVFDDDSYGGNVTYAEFNKEGKHFYLVIDQPGAYVDELINLTDDVKLIKEMKDSLKVKE